MKKVLVKMNNFTDITTFVKQAAEVIGDVTLYKGRYAIDGKSIMGIMSIDVSTGFYVEYPAEATIFDSYVQQFIVK